jgi:hypothetical protein
MFGSTRNQVRKRVEQAEWIQSELRDLQLEKVWLKCLDYYHPEYLSNIVLVLKNVMLIFLFLFYEPDI